MSLGILALFIITLGNNKNAKVPQSQTFASVGMGYVEKTGAEKSNPLILVVIKTKTRIFFIDNSDIKSFVIPFLPLSSDQRYNVLK